MYQRLSEIRNKLISIKDMDTYNLFVSFLRNPNEELVGEILCNQEIQEMNVREVMADLMKLHATERGKYTSKIANGQWIIWKEIYTCVNDILNNTEKIEKYKFIEYGDNYLKACQVIKELVAIYVDSQTKVCYLEERLGVDRYLDKISERELIAINDLILIQCKKINEFIETYIFRFQRDWGNDNIPAIVYHKLYSYNGENQICTMLKPDQKKVILFVVDGMGWCQYQWHKDVCKDGSGYAFKEGIFDWLCRTGNSKELILGAPFITDTAAGLAQIFTGKKAKKTGIIASKLMRNNFFIDTKKLEVDDFENNFNTDYNSMTAVLSEKGYSNEILFCTRYDRKHEGFSKQIFKDSDITEIIPPERVYEILLKKIQEGKLLDFTGVYSTSIDNSGHTMGAFSKFEKYEHHKINALFKNFLLELAEKCPERFDDNTSILFVADHGMAESSKKIIYRENLLDILSPLYIKNIKIMIDNRAAFIYGIDGKFQSKAKEILHEYFAKINVDVQISTKEGCFLNEFMPKETHKSAQLVPDMILRLVSNGLFYHANILKEELLHFAGHGGASLNETLVPLIEVNLSAKLLADLKDRFIDMM